MSNDINLSAGILLTQDRADMVKLGDSRLFELGLSGIEQYRVRKGHSNRSGLGVNGNIVTRSEAGNVLRLLVELLNLPLELIDGGLILRDSVCELAFFAG